MKQLIDLLINSLPIGIEWKYLVFFGEFFRLAACMPPEARQNLYLVFDKNDPHQHLSYSFIKNPMDGSRTNVKTFFYTKYYLYGGLQLDFRPMPGQAPIVDTVDISRLSCYKILNIEELKQILMPVLLIEDPIAIQKAIKAQYPLVIEPLPVDLPSRLWFERWKNIYIVEIDKEKGIALFHKVMIPYHLEM